MYGYGSLKQRITCDFKRFQPYNKIASKGGVGGLNVTELCDSYKNHHNWLFGMKLVDY